MIILLTLRSLDARRIEIIRKMSEIKSMRKGTVNEQYKSIRHKNGETVAKGPYYVLTHKASGGKTVSEAVPSSNILYMRQEVDNYKEFRELTNNYIDVCEKMSTLYHAAEKEDAKKN